MFLHGDTDEHLGTFSSESILLNPLYGIIEPITGNNQGGKEVLTKSRVHLISIFHSLSIHFVCFFLSLCIPEYEEFNVLKWIMA